MDVGVVCFYRYFKGALEANPLNKGDSFIRDFVHYKLCKYYYWGRTDCFYEDDEFRYYCLSIERRLLI